MTKALVLLGSTGSIGTQALEVCKELGIKICGLSAHRNIDLLEQQILEFNPQLVCVTDEKSALELKNRIGNKPEIITGVDGLVEVASMNGADTVLNALVGVVGLRPTVAAIESGKDIALANKEVLVTAGKLIMELAHKRQVRILPVDSEHSAIFQCLQGNTGNSVRAIYLTASGGPFLKKSKSELETVTSADALKHPNWVMGSKITIDSATMMNKGLEVIEALWLFDLKLEQIKVLVHPQSIVHSMVEFEDSAIIAQLGAPDMRLPIQYALAYPNRPNSGYDRLDLLSCPPLSFESPDRERFPCLRLAIEAAAKGGLLPAVMNGANEVAVAEFLNGSIPFLKIPKIIESVMCSYNNGEENYSINDVIDADRWARKRIHEYLNR